MRLSTFILLIAGFGCYAIGGFLVEVAAGVQKYQNNDALADKWGYSGLTVAGIGGAMILFVVIRIIVCEFKRRFKE